MKIIAEFKKYEIFFFKITEVAPSLLAISDVIENRRRPQTFSISSSGTPPVVAIFAVSTSDIRRNSRSKSNARIARSRRWEIASPHLWKIEIWRSRYRSEARVSNLVIGDVASLRERLKREASLSYLSFPRHSGGPLRRRW
ncbi:hypothetical protein TIFTF001_002178 [Ficus carica]|uniref:Uncharacterized protein n=1 Tax=Ficus carica TaxID=3494 RepID=A0AA87ZLP9_FICCA|nr:hypothetical protein TIFTF001_002178 [Ficus carica]